MERVESVRLQCGSILAHQSTPVPLKLELHVQSDEQNEAISQVASCAVHRTQPEPKIIISCPKEKPHLKQIRWV